jgi:hypothetical protein
MEFIIDGWMKSNINDAPPNSLMDSTMDLKVKQWKEKELGRAP